MSEEESAVSQAQEAREESAPAVDVWGLLHYCFLLLHASAWQKMGLVPDPATGKVVKDLEQARVAIDTAAYLAERLESRLTGQQLRDLRAMLSDLRLNFVQQSARPD